MKKKNEMDKKKSIQFLNIEKEDPFFSELAKKYKGRFYKKLKGSYGWSFSEEYKDVVQKEYQDYMKKLDNESSNDDDDSSSSEPIENNSIVSLSSSSSEHPMPILDRDDDELSSSESDTIEKVDKSTQTDPHEYEFNVPEIYKNQFTFYQNLI